MNGDNKYPLHEMFHSFQGEGVHTGRSAFFIRLHGCPVQCSWCDAWQTWKTNKFERVEAKVIAEAAIKERPEIIVITGGEPLIHKLNPLMDECDVMGIPCHVETSGVVPLNCQPDWITVAPKSFALPHDDFIWSNEYKVVVDTIENCEIILTWLRDNKMNDDAPIWILPEWSQRNNSEIVNYIVEQIKTSDLRLRAMWQIHKEYQADEQDPRHTT